MKRNLLFFFFFLLISLISCQKEENSADRLKGSLSINIGLFISVSEVDNNLKSTFDTEDFKVSIFSISGDEVLVFEKATEMPEEIDLAPGQYYVTAHSQNNVSAAFDSPYYFGESEEFSITPGGQQTIGVNCELANTMITIVYADNIKSNFSDFSTTVSSTAGSLTFSKDETRVGYFQPLPLNISAVLTWQKADGTYESKTLYGSIPAPQPKKHYEIHVNASSAGGSALLQISLDETAVPVEIVQITDNDESPVSGLFDRGDLLITEIMYDPDTLTDTQGEWFEIYNNTNFTVNLQKVVIRKNDTENHIINSSVLLAAHNFYVLARTEAAVSCSKYVYNTAISLNNTGAVLSLYNYGSDGTDGSLICSINYGAAGFPIAKGASLCLDPESFNNIDAVLGNSWCVSTTSYSTGDLGTPGLPNDNCP
jgi:hypothetical protein